MRGVHWRHSRLGTFRDYLPGCVTLATTLPIIRITLSQTVLSYMYIVLFLGK